MFPGRLTCIGRSLGGRDARSESRGAGTFGGISRAFKEISETLCPFISTGRSGGSLPSDGNGS